MRKETDGCSWCNGTNERVDGHRASVGVADLRRSLILVITKLREPTICDALAPASRVKNDENASCDVRFGMPRIQKSSYESLESLQSRLWSISDDPLTASLIFDLSPC